MKMDFNRIAHKAGSSIGLDEDMVQMQVCGTEYSGTLTAEHCLAG
jgi:hypothetical protein